MSRKNHRSGGKFCGSHTTLIDTAIVVADEAARQPEVTGVSPGLIKPGLNPANGQRRVKISEEKGAILLQIRNNTSQQTVRIYSNNFQQTKMALARYVRDAGLHLAFGKSETGS